MTTTTRLTVRNDRYVLELADGDLGRIRLSVHDRLKDLEVLYANNQGDDEIGRMVSEYRVLRDALEVIRA